MSRVIEVENYQGKDRRNGNGRMKISISDYIKITTIVVGLFVAGIAGYFRMDNSIQAFAEKAEAIGTLKEKDLQQDKDILIIQCDVSEIKEDVNEIQTEQMIQTKLLNQIWGKINNVN